MTINFRTFTKPAALIAAGAMAVSTIMMPGLAFAAEPADASVNADQASSAEGSTIIYGTDFTDNIKLDGFAGVAGTWTATVQYNSSLIDALDKNGVPGKDTSGTTTDDEGGAVDGDFGDGGFQVFDSSTGTWSAADANGRANDGKVDLLYSTEKGPWKDGSTIDGDKNPDGGGDEHINGVYLLTVPTAISYSGMHVGKVSTSDNYVINVQGVLPAGKAVKVWAESGKVLDGPTDANSQIIETTSMASPNQAGATGAYSGGEDDAYGDSDNYRVVSAREAVNTSLELKAGNSGSVAPEFVQN